MSSILSNNHYLFTSESVGEGHPDKVCDQISDAILDRCLQLDPECHVACETFATTNFALCGGEIGFQTGSKEEQEKNAEIIKKEAEEIARKVICQIGYDDDALLFNGNNCEFLNKLHAQSSDINQGVVAIGIGASIGFAGLGSGMGQGMAAASSVGAIVEDNDMFARGIIFSALPETQAIYGFLIAILLMVFAKLLGA